MILTPIGQDGQLPGYEGRGIATTMARALVQIARQEDAALVVFAHSPTETTWSVSMRPSKPLGDEAVLALADASSEPDDYVQELALEVLCDSLPGQPPS